jgi:Tfp pilus assembly protein PilV
MYEAPPSKSSTPNRQQGAALFMALIVLLVLTVLGVFGMNIARLQNLMAGNTQFQTSALNNAETTLAVGEEDVESVLGTSKNWNTSGDWYYDRTIESTEVIDPTQSDWTSKFVYQTIPKDTPASLFRYVLEYAGEYTDYQCSVKWGATYSDVCKRYIFLVTAQNEASRGAKRTVQSVYVSATPP